MNFITVFAAIGLVFVIMYVFWYIMNKIKDATDNVTTNNISPNYMQEIGLRCPDYYVNTLNNNEMSTCKNSYNLDQNIDSESGDSNSSSSNCANVKCYHDIENKTVNFQDISNWKDLDDNQRIDALKNDGKMDNTTNRCDWIKCCGVAVGGSSTSQPWLEISDYCDSVSSIN